MSTFHVCLLIWLVGWIATSAYRIRREFLEPEYDGLPFWDESPTAIIWFHFIGWPILLAISVGQKIDERVKKYAADWHEKYQEKQNRRAK